MKIKNVIVVVVLSVVMFSFSFNVYAISLNNNYIVFSEGNKSISKELEFDVEKSENVKAGKFAPGLKATLEAYIDVSDLDYDVEIEIGLKEEMYDFFEISPMIDDQKYDFGDSVIVQKDDFRQKKFNVELVWKSSDFDNIYIANSFDKLSIPFYVKVKQRMK